MSKLSKLSKLSKIARKFILYFGSFNSIVTAIDMLLICCMSDMFTYVSRICSKNCINADDDSKKSRNVHLYGNTRYQDLH